MNKFVKWTLIVVVSLGVLLMLVGYFGRMYTKSFSPQETVTFEQGGASISVYYSRPYKKDRDIFGGLVPHGEVWRTGANEPTEFNTSTDLNIGGQTLPAGTYSLWTIPNPDSWEVIWNNGEYGWGVNMEAKASREAQYDVVSVTVPVENLNQVVEQFTIAVDKTGLSLAWDQTKVTVDLGL